MRIFFISVCRRSRYTSKTFVFTDAPLEQRPPSGKTTDSNSAGSSDEMCEARDLSDDSAPSSGQNNAQGLIINALLASSKSPPGDHGSNEALPEAVLFQKQVAPTGDLRVVRDLNEDIDEFSTAWKTLDWQNHWSSLLLTMLMSGTVIVTVGVVIAVTYGRRPPTR